MRAANVGKENPHIIQSLKLNGQPYTKTYITYHDIMDGDALRNGEPVKSAMGHQG